MKRILFVLAITLILTVCFIGEAFALSRPWTEAGNGPNGEEHPWGGDEHATDPPPFTVKISNPGSFATGIVPVDLIFRYFIMDNVSIFEKNNSERQSIQNQRIEFRKYSTAKNKGNRK